MPRPCLFGSFNLLPLCPDTFHILDFDFSEHMRMATNQFLNDVTRDLIKIKGASFLGKLAVKDDLQQQISQFFHHFVIVPRFNCIHQFVNFLDRVKAEALVRLFAIPRATFGRTEFGHDLYQIIDRRLVAFHRDFKK